MIGPEREYPLRVAGAEGLKELVNQDIYPPHELEITQEAVTGFGILTHDLQWIHADPAAAQRSPFGITIAQGFLTLSLITYFVTNAVKVEKVRLGLGCGVDRARFLSPVPVGTHLKSRLRIKQLRELRDCAEVVWSVALVRDGKLVPLCIADWTVRYYQ